jgi:hypothetical protein
MRHLRHTVLAALAVALCIAPVAGADASRTGGAAVIAPAKDKWLGESWATVYASPVGELDPCVMVAPKVVQEFGDSCTIEQGTTFTLGFGTAWSSAEDPFPQTRAEQLALATAADLENVVGMTVTVDGGDPVQIRVPRFELFSPQRTVLLPEDNILDNPGEGIDVPAQIVTLSAHGWGAAIRKLSVGEHNVVGDTLFASGEHFIRPHPLTVVPRHHG